MPPAALSIRNDGGQRRRIRAGTLLRRAPSGVSLAASRTRSHRPRPGPKPGGSCCRRASARRKDPLLPSVSADPHGRAPMAIERSARPLLPTRRRRTPPAPDRRGAVLGSQELPSRPAAQSTASQPGRGQVQAARRGPPRSRARSHGARPYPRRRRARRAVVAYEALGRFPDLRDRTPALRGRLLGARRADRPICVGSPRLHLSGEAAFLTANGECTGIALFVDRTGPNSLTATLGGTGPDPFQGRTAQRVVHALLSNWTPPAHDRGPQTTRAVGRKEVVDAPSAARGALVPGGPRQHRRQIWQGIGRTHRCLRELAQSYVVPPVDSPGTRRHDAVSSPRVWRSPPCAKGCPAAWE